MKIFMLLYFDIEEQLYKISYRDDTIFNQLKNFIVKSVSDDIIMILGKATYNDKLIPLSQDDFKLIISIKELKIIDDV